MIRSTPQLPRRTLSTRALTGLALVGPLIGGLATLSGCNSTKGPSREQKVALYYENALRYYHLGEYDRAQAQAQKGLGLDPHDVDLRVTLARTLQQREERDTLRQAEGLYRELVKEAPKDSRVFLGLAECLERQGILYSESADQIQSGERFTESADPAERAAELHEDARNFWLEAVERYGASNEISEGLEAVNGLQRVHTLLGEHEQSLAWSEDLLEQLGGRLAAWRAQLAIDQITAEQERKYRNLVAKDEQLELATQLYVASTLSALDRHQDAIGRLNRVLELNPDLAEAYSRRGWHQLQLGEYDRAIESLDRFLALAPIDSPEAARAWDLRDEAQEARDAR